MPHHRYITVINILTPIIPIFTDQFPWNLLYLQFKVMLKGPSSLKSYSGLPFNVLKASGRALIAYSPNQSPWDLL